ncbi:SGNH/GDSL hydrolase family protein [Argonema antarcticum]|uniref:SGNH/GDSL hydrolase family protein n=1 Tax=Argonema antarcticum TaxID=2942763 RepID=UPI00201144FB|nr:SGNH/GDSL hydrolase family protein [Argonema antarcticum]MCL1469137.1 SGNH/GDSL hydrolase family protein [Argonema antarcticum A004/B2]
MSIKRLWIATAGVAIALAIIFVSPSGILAQNFDRIYVFGDSLSDMGNVFKATNKKAPTSPPYFQGRYSNGPVWVEYLASKLKLPLNLNNNFAYAGATTGDSQALPPGVLAQIDRFKATNSAVDPIALYIIWAGANDYLGGATDTTAPVNNLVKAVKSLAAVGAKNIVVVNLPDLGKLPGTRIIERSNLLSNLSKKHNSELAASVNGLQQKLSDDINITYLDVNSLFNLAITSPEKLGFKNVKKPCLIKGRICDNPNEYLFWDNIHPSTATHKLLVELTFSALKPVPKSTPSFILKFTITLIIIVLFCALCLVSILNYKKAKRKRA